MGAARLAGPDAQQWETRATVHGHSLSSTYKLPVIVLIFAFRPRKKQLMESDDQF